MRANISIGAICGSIAVLCPSAFGQGIPADDPVRALVGRLDLERYKATIKGLTEFGDRRQGTDRNRAAVDWIERQLKSFGCNTGRIKYEYNPPAPQSRPQGRVPSPVIASGEIRTGSGGSRLRGNTAPTGVNDNPDAQPDVKLRELNSQPSAPGAREEVYCTKIGATRPDEMYIVSAHMDGIGWGEAADDNGSGTALVMELARVLNSPDVRTERSIRFALWNNEETGLNGSRAYVAQRAALQGKEDPPGSGRYPEPNWLGMIQHDMVLFDHGMPRADGTLSPEQRPEADVNIEFQSTAKFADQALKLAFFFRDANEKYATDYPAAVSHHMTNTDSTPFMDFTPAISVREHERGMQIGAGWNPHWHQPTDRYSTYSDKDFRLGLNAAQTTLAAIAQLAGAALKK
ncbi:MAG TPA: M20/M25/M40 family metallo-hydrolase [Burkholderiales bacterium]|nr:M20/M25/M40 family metallo-hydrolase [Burkholderiales bacterium]